MDMARNFYRWDIRALVDMRITKVDVNTVRKIKIIQLRFRQLRTIKMRRIDDIMLNRELKKVLPLDPDPEKAKSAEIFKEYYEKAKNDPEYQSLKEQHIKQFGKEKFAFLNNILYPHNYE